jgi:polysaccharide export outer membrane protein
MTRNHFHASLLAVVLLMSATRVGHAQISTQQMSGYQGETSRNQNRSDAASAMHSSGLVMVPEDFSRLRLAPGFLVSLNVLDDHDFQGYFRVDQDGNIAVPILGTIQVAGETVSEARAQIRKRLLDDRILKDPQVDLNVVEYTAPVVTVIGEVASPGKYPLLAQRKLVDVLALAGGTTIAAGDEIQIVREKGNADPVLVHYSRSMNPKAVEDLLVQPGDTVQVKRSGIVYVLGAVVRPGGYVMQEEGTLTVLQAISLANGTTLPASISSIHLLRRNADSAVVDIAVPLDKMSHGKSADMQLRASDVLYVPTSKVKSALINGAAILASATSATIYAVTIY